MRCDPRNRDEQARVLQEALGTTRGSFSVYVIKLTSDVRDSPRRQCRWDDTSKPCVYVGQTSKSVEERFADHLTGHNSRISRYVDRLMPELYEHYNPLDSREQAEAVEQALGCKLYWEGYTLLGGH